MGVSIVDMTVPSGQGFSQLFDMQVYDQDFSYFGCSYMQIL